MNKKLIAFLSITLTVFVFITAAVLISNVSAKNSAAIPQEVQDQLTQRDQAYNDVITEANQRIALLNAELEAIKKETAADSTSQVVVSPDQAALIALSSINYQEPLSNLPELVNFEGATAYEVQLISGSVYVDSQTGEILFSSVLQKISADEAAVIAGEYLGGMDPRYATVKQSQLNGSEVYQVSFNNYVVTLDQYGNVLQAQVFQYTDGNASTSQTSSQNNSSVNSTSSNNSDNHDDDDHDDDHGDDHDDD